MRAPGELQALAISSSEDGNTPRLCGVGTSGNNSITELFPLNWGPMSAISNIIADKIKGEKTKVFPKQGITLLKAHSSTLASDGNLTKLPRCKRVSSTR